MNWNECTYYRSFLILGAILVGFSWRHWKKPRKSCHIELCTLSILYFDVFLKLTEGFLTLTDAFPCFFLSCKANVRVKLAKTGHGPHSSTLVVICIFRLLFALFYVLFVCKCIPPPGDNPIAVNKYINTRRY